MSQFSNRVPGTGSTSGFASEGDHEVDVTNELRINECGCVSCDVDTDLGQGLSGQVVDGGAGLGARRVHLHGVACDLAHQPGGHLGLAAVLDADEQHRRRAVGFGHQATGGDAEFVEEAADPLFDVVADRADRVDGLAGGIGQFPVLVPLSGEERAGVAAPHGDDDVGGLDDLVGPGLGELAGDVDVDLGHRLHRGRVDLVAGFGAAGPGDALITGEVVEVPERHLGAACVVGAQEQHGGLGVGDLAFDSCQGGESLACPAFGQQREEVGNGCPAGELVVGGVQEPFDGLDAEVLAEFGVQPRRRRLRSASCWSMDRSGWWWTAWDTGLSVMMRFDQWLGMLLCRG